MLFEHLLHAIDHGVELVLGLDLFALRLVFGGMRVSFLGHALDFFLAQAGRRGDRNLLVLARGHVFRGHVEDAVGIDVERHFNLRHAPRSRRKPGQVELAQRAVLRRHRPLALQHVHLNRGLVVGGGRKGFRLLGRNGGVARNHWRRHAAERLDRERQRSHVEQKQVFYLSAQNATLNGRADCHHFIWIHALVGFPAEQVLHQRLDARHAGLPADQHDFVDLAGVDACVLHALFAGPDRALNDVFHHRLQLRSGQLLDQMLGAAGVSGDERQIDLVLHGGRELNLGPLCRVAQTLQRHLVALAAQIEAFVLLEFVYQPVDNALVQVVPTQMGIAVGRLDFDDAFPDFENRDVKGPAAEVIHGDGLVLFLVEAIGQRSCRGLVDNALHFEPGDLARVLGGLALGVVEIRRHGDHRVVHLFAEVVFGRLLQLLQNHGGNLGRGVLLALRQHGHVVARLHDLVGDHLDFFRDFVIAASHEPLDRVHRVFRIGDGLPLGHLANQPFARLGKSDDRWRGSATFFIGDHFRLATFHNRYTGVGGSEINSDNLAHDLTPPGIISAL